MKTFQNQYFASFCANLPSLQCGMLVGWCSPILPILLSPNSPLSHGAITAGQAFLIASIFSVGGAAGAVFGLLINRIGRKYTLVINGFLQTIAWAMMLCSENIFVLYVSRCLGGLASEGALIAAPIFVIEITDKKIRGRLSSWFSLNSNLGLLVGYTVGAFSSYIPLPLIGTVIGIVFVIWMLFLPETPLYLYSQQRVKEAELLANFYNYELKIEHAAESNDKSVSKAKGISFSGLCIKSTRRAITISTCLIILSQFSGFPVFVNYASQIFQDAGASLHPNIAAIIVACLQLVGSYVSTVLVDKAGRKFLLSASSFGTFIALTGMAVFVYLKHINVDVSEIAWMPLLFLSTGLCVISIGLRSIPFIIAAETLPQNVQGPYFAFIAIVMWIISYICVQYFSYAVSVVYLHGCMFFFAMNCLLFLLYTIFCVPETKGKFFEEIEAMLLN